MLIGSRPINPSTLIGSGTRARDMSDTVSGGLRNAEMWRQRSADWRYSRGPWAPAGSKFIKPKGMLRGGLLGGKKRALVAGGGALALGGYMLGRAANRSSGSVGLQPHASGGQPPYNYY